MRTVVAIVVVCGFLGALAWAYWAISRPGTDADDHDPGW